MINKKLISILIIMVLVFSMTAVASEKSDKTTFNNWSDYNIYAGSQELSTIGTKLDRVNLAYMIAEAFDLEMISEPIAIEDVSDKDWHNKYVQLVISHGIMNVDENGRFNPNDFILREELPKYLNYYKLELPENTENTEKYLDIVDTSPENLELFKKFVSANLINDNDSEYIFPTRIATISDAINILDNMFPNVSSGISKGSVYEGNFILKEKMSYLENITINGDLIITQGAMEGNFVESNFRISLVNVTVNGNIYIYGGSHYGSYNFKGSKAGDIHIRTNSPVIVNVDESKIGKIFNSSDLANFYTNMELDIQK